MTRIIAVALQKGGVGKTTTVQHVGHALATLGRTVLLLDLDSQASLTNRYDLTGLRGTLSDVLGAEGPPTMTLREIIIPTYQENLFLAPASENLVYTNKRLSTQSMSELALNKLLRSERLPFEYIIVDTAPGRSELQFAALVAADELIVPVQVSPMGFEGFYAIDKVIAEARDAQEQTGGVRLRYRSVLPTFYAQGEKVSDSFLLTLGRAEHPDYAGEPLPLAPLPVPETTAFEQVSASMRHGDSIRAQTIFEIPAGGDDTPTARGQRAYMELARYVDEYV